MIHPVVIGIDVSKATLDVFDPGRGPARMANSAEALGPLVDEWAARGCIVVFEATGRYDAVLAGALEKAGVAHARVNPAQARDFARAIGVKAKTDPVDARLLAEMGRRLNLRLRTAVDQERARLARLHRRRDQLVDMRKQEMVRAHGETDPDLRASLEAHLAFLDTSIAAIEAECAAAVTASPTLREADRRLRTVPGVGEVTARTLLALMPELGQATPKAVAALAGLAPYNVDSGAFRGRRTVRGGRARVRHALYMAALSLGKSDTPLGRWFRALREAGKPVKLARIALARKLLITLNAMMRNNQDFQTA